MKKTGILAVSLCAIMAVGVARADIASVGYVDDRTGDTATLTTTATNLTGAVNELNTAVKGTDGKGLEQIANKVQTVPTDLAKAVESTTNYPSMAVANEIATQRASDAVADKLNQNQGTTNANKAMVVNAAGAVVPGQVVEAGIADNAVTTAKIKDANVTKAKLESSVQASLAKADTSLQAADKTELSNKITAETTRAEAAEKTITDTIGEVETGKTVVEMITAATYDDTELSGKVTANTNAITAINNSDVMKSTITAAKVTSYDNTVSAVTNADTGLAATRTLAQKGVDDAAAAKGVADAALPKVNATVAEGTYNHIKAGDDVKGNLVLLDTAVKNASGSATTALNDAKAYTDEQLGALDLATQTGNGVIKTVSQTDGQVAMTRGLAEKADLATEVQASLGKADTALQKNGALTAGNLVTTNASGQVIDGGKKGALAGLDAVTSAQITNGTIVNEDIAANAAIDSSKIAGLSELAKATNMPAACAEGKDCALSMIGGVLKWEVIK